MAVIDGPITQQSAEWEIRNFAEMNNLPVDQVKLVYMGGMSIVTTAENHPGVSNVTVDGQKVADKVCGRDIYLSNLHELPDAPVEKSFFNRMRELFSA